MNQAKQTLLEWIDQDRELLIGFLQDFLRYKNPNPPGNTMSAANFVTTFLESRNLPFKRIAPQADRPNIVATTEFARPGKHLVLNGHIDVFPVGPESDWTRDPWGGELADGRIYGRGSADMKCGTTASIFTYVYLNRLKETLNGRLTLTVVSDEETFGEWGTRYLMEHNSSEILGDCCLIGEPSSLHTTRFGEKGPLWLTVKVATPGGHGAYVHTSKNAIAIATSIMTDLLGLADREVIEAPALKQALDEASDAIERAYGQGASKTIRSVTVNLGTIKGGAKVNMIASDCEFEVDLRIPNGFSREALLKEVQEIIWRYPEASYVVQGGNEPNWCEPNAELYDHVQANAERITGIRPAKVVSPGGTDARLWRMRNVPAVVYGPSPTTMGRPDEHVTVEEFFAVVKTHALSAYDYLSAPRD
jgi:succinyl-diaminopimelate desuccinylase